MMLVLWIAVIVIGLTASVWSSRNVVKHAGALAHGRNIPPFFVGMTLLAIGTDLPEIANSIVSSLSGHGDLNVGDSVGSATTQLTLVFGLFPFVAGAVWIDRGRVVSMGGAICVALLIGAVVVADGYLSRTDAVILVLVWLLAAVALWRREHSRPQVQAPDRTSVQHAVRAGLGLVITGAGATAAVKGFIEIASMLSVSEYLLSFFVTSIGTSLPELFVDATAIRRGQSELAVGGVFGSSMADATLSMASGPLIAPTVITASSAVRGAVLAAVLIGLVTGLLALARRHGRVTGAALVIMYLLAYPALIGGL